MKFALINPNSNPATTQEMCEIAMPYLSVTPWGWTATDGPKMITTPAALHAAAQQVAQADLPADMRAVIVAAFGDPGAEALARRLPCPVVGIGAAAARAAAADDAPFAVATTTPMLSQSITEAMTRHAPKGRYVGTFISDTDPQSIMLDDAALDAALLEQVRIATAQGAHRVIIGGGPLGRAATRLAPISPVPLINPIIAACNELRDQFG
ncbi:aspartate/glutamate racemase family protein [Celeribacter halophilus]|uniref:aspartate/glutamate racemase family protein n=1 Tax=Celeribacter halophilus TaxID=576117 RepID=UPI0026E2AA22|nr:aspartate/glutamate racemase family protein [Celeribacter halophilus]MDO6722399.1 aspartate/glutamate racemase family protein [Celeribacter halophilus]